MRLRLYWLTLAYYGAVFSVLFAAAVMRDVVVPILKWPSDVVRFFAPGLPANLIEIAMMFPVPGAILVLIAILLGWMNRQVRIEEAECAYRSWAWLRGDPSLCSMQQRKPISLTHQIAWTSPVFPLISVLLAAVSLTLSAATISIALFSNLFAIPSSKVEIDSGAQIGSKRSNSAGPMRLAGGESVQIVIAARNTRNETALFLEKGSTYTAKHIESKRWRDGLRAARSWGVEFTGAKGLVAGLLEWLRPYPAGGWFQVLGRIDRGRQIFPVLGESKECAAIPYRFTAPADGELVLLVNDIWYQNNSGFMTLEIQRPRQKQGGTTGHLGTNSTTPVAFTDCSR